MILDSFFSSEETIWKSSFFEKFLEHRQTRFDGRLQAGCSHKLQVFLIVFFQDSNSIFEPFSATLEFS